LSLFTVIKYLLIFAVIQTTSLNAAEISFRSMQVAYIQKFTAYIEWGQRADDAFEIAVIDDNDTFKEMETAFKGKLVENRKVIVLDEAKLTKTCEIIYIPKITKSIMDRLKETCSEKALIISQDPRGLQEKIIINFFLEDDGRVRFDINNTQANLNQIKINSRLLNLARSTK